jgi:hypothetical protein
MEAEIDRAMVWQINAETGAYKPYATGLRNPTALAIQPGSGSSGRWSTSATNWEKTWCRII